MLSSNPDFQHTLRIVQKYNLTYSNPLFAPLAALGGGAGLALVLGLFTKGLPTPDQAAPSPTRASWGSRLLHGAAAPFLRAGRFLTRGRLGFVTVAFAATFLSYSSAHSKAIYFDKKFPALQLMQD